MSTHSEAARHFVADAERMAWHDRALYAVREKRDRMMESIPEWEALRSAASQIKLHTLSRLGHYLEEFERNATANGMVVHWAADGAAMNEIVWQLIREHGGRRLIKSKSMLSEECGLTPYLEKRGVEAVESDLGERIMQLLHMPPSHIVLPAIGVRREEVGALFEREMGTEPGNSDPTYLTHAARHALRPKFLEADVSMTGVNFAVASTGALAVCTNEGNADLGTSFADLHIAIMGLEKVIPDMRALGVFTRLLARSGTGQARDDLHVALPPARARAADPCRHRRQRPVGVAGRCRAPQHAQVPALRRLHEHLSGLPPFGRLLLLLFYPRAAGHQPLDAAFAAAAPRQCLGLHALLLLLGRLPGEDRPRRADLPLAAAARFAASGRSGEEDGRQGDGFRHGRSAPLLRRHRPRPRRRPSAACAARKPPESVVCPRPRHAALRIPDIRCTMEKNEET